MTKNVYAPSPQKIAFPRDLPPVNKMDVVFCCRGSRGEKITIKSQVDSATALRIQGELVRKIVSERLENDHD